MRAVRFDRYGDIDVLKVVEAPMPRPGPGRVVVEVRAAGINPADALLRRGAFAAASPVRLPSGEGSDFSGVIVAVGEDVMAFALGDEVLGWSEEHASHATHVSVAADHLVRKPAQLSWEVAGALYVAGMAAWASVEAVDPKQGEVVVVSGAAGGVGSIAIQLLGLRGATVIGIASPRNHGWLRQRGVIPVDHDEHTAERVGNAAYGRVDAWIDAFGGGYVDMAIQLGVAPARINTIIDFAAAQQHGANMMGSHAAGGAAALGKLAALVAEGKVDIPIAARYPLDRVQEAFRDLERRQTRGKIVLVS